VNSQYYVVGAPWPVWFGNNSNISNYKDNGVSGDLKTWSTTTTWAATPRINKEWPKTFTFTNQSTGKTLTVTTPRGLTSFKENSINNVKGETTFTAPMVSGMSCNAGNMQDVQWATSALKQAAARGVSLTNLADGLMSPVTAASYNSRILTAGNNMGSVSGTGIVLISGTKGNARSLGTAVWANAFSSNAATITSAAWVGPGWIYAHADSAGPNPSSSRYDGGSGRIFSIDSTGWLTEKTSSTNWVVNRVWNSASGGGCSDIWWHSDDNTTGGTANFAVGLSRVQCKKDKHGVGTNAGKYGGQLVDGLLGTAYNGRNIVYNYAIEAYRNFNWPNGTSVKPDKYQGPSTDTSAVHAQFLFPVFCAAWR
ncbi:hypothetical protein A6586_25835, partial [Escherichia coli]